MKLKIIIITLCLLVLALSSFSAVNYYNTARQAALQENHHHSTNRVIESAERIDAMLKERRLLVEQLARQKDLIAALEDPSPEIIARANQSLSKFHDINTGGIFYLLDKNGDTLASSNFQDADSFVGQNYAFRPYFQEALRGHGFTFPALGLTSGKKGLYLSQPIPDSTANQVIGVAVAKLPLDRISQTINPDLFRGVIALTGPDDLIFFSNRPALENHFLWQNPSPEMTAILEQERQFGPGPWEWAGFEQTSTFLARGPRGKTFNIHQHQIDSVPGWKLVYLHDNSAFSTILTANLTRRVGMFLGAILLLVGSFVVLLYRLAGRELLLKKELEEELRSKQQLLEEEATERTAELRNANRQLLVKMDQHQKDAAELEQNNKTMQLLNKILGLALTSSSLQEFLNDFMMQSESFTPLDLLPKGALFLVDEEEPGYLKLQAQYGLDQSLITTCSRVKFGHCICGRAAQSGKVLFVNQIDQRHENTYPGIIPHGHYCVPIHSSSGELIGLYNIYTRPDIAHNQRIEDFLVTVATVLSGIIRLKQTSQMIMESEEKHRAITDTAQDAIITIDHEGRTIFWNPAATRIFGYTREEVLGRDLHDLITPKRFIPEAMRGFGEFLKTGQGPLIGKTVDIVGRRKDGSEIDIELSLSALHRQSHWSAIGILRDISNRKKAEKEKAQLQTQLRQAQKMEAIGTLAGGIAHDFNNILSSILGYADLVKEELPETCAGSLDDLDQVIKAGNRAKDLVKQILAFSRQTEDEFVPVQISLIVKEATKLLRASLPSSIEIRQIMSDSALTVYADPSQIHQVLMNLCTNAFKAMRDKGGILEIRLESYSPDQTFQEKYPDLQAEKYVCMVVSDTGIGMDNSILPRIFEPYFSTNKKEDGTGLGLAVVHGIITRLAGAIEVTSAVGHGSTFKVFLPVAEKPTPLNEQPVTEQIPRGSERILIVDDELPILELSQRMLGGLGYDITCRTSSIEALELFRHQPDKFDLVITDQNMPNMTGVKMAEEMIAIRPDIPILLCTGYADLNISQHSRGKSIREIVMKPLARSQMAAAVRRLLDNS